MGNRNPNLIAPQSDSRIKTYVLMGDDIPYDFLGGNRQIIERQKGQAIARAIAQIKGPANIVLDAHGDLDGRFIWKSGEKLPYRHLFDALPKDGILSLTITSCFGGLAQQKRILEAAPPGMLVITLAGSSTVQWDTHTRIFANETQGLSNPIDLYIKGLDNLPTDVLKYLHSQVGYSDPEASMPKSIGIGGNPPQIIDLAQRINDSKKLDDRQALGRAVGRVQSLFDTYRYYDGGAPKEKGRVIRTFVPKSLGAEKEQELDRQIAEMAEKLAQGKKPKTMEEKRISYALMAAYLEESGELKKLISQQSGYRAPDLEYRDAHGKPIDPNAPLHNATGLFAGLQNDYYAFLENENKKKGITHHEQAYINSVAKKLREANIDPEKVSGLLKGLVGTFVASPENDAIRQDLAKQLREVGISTQGWER